MKVDYPITQSLDFFDNPDEILSFAKSVEYFKPEYTNYPGKRSRNISEINYPLFEYICIKHLLLFYSYSEVTNMEFGANMYFQKITSKDTRGGEGLIHRDFSDLMTAIIYLSPNLNNIGTEMWVPKKEWDSNTESSDIFNSIPTEDIVLKESERKDNKFVKVSSHNSIFNSCVYLDGAYYHSANLNIPEDEERLTLITFFKNIKSPSKTPIVRTGLA